MLGKLTAWWHTQLRPRRVAQPAGLISVLLNPQAEYGSRHDAAMDLHRYDTPEVAHALARVASDAHTDPDLAAECGETLALLWVNHGSIDVPVLSQLQPAAFALAVRTLRGIDPQWDRLLVDLARQRSTSQYALASTTGDGNNT